MLKRLIAMLSTLVLLGTGAQGADSDGRLLRVFVHGENESIAEFVGTYRKQFARSPVPPLQRAQLQRIDREQEALRKQLAPFIEREHSALKVALNGFRASVRSDLLGALRAQPGVKAVRLLRPIEPDNVYSVPWVEAPKLWDNTGTGENVTIAIIDTGIDYTHANFGGSGSTADFQNNMPGIIEPGTFPTAKIIGGWDFAGPTYNSREEKDPEPDPDPLDIHGHGSHVAGTAAGLGVPQVVGPGVAPGATLLALKVFSDIGGSTDLTVDAIDRALDPNQDGIMDDAVDVINMSLGARFGLPQDPSAVAAANAMNAGVVVVASAGNNGDLPYVTGSPGSSPPIITVAATTPGDRRQIALKVTGGAATPQFYIALEGSSSVRIPLIPDIREIVLARNTAADTGTVVHDACTSFVNPDDLTDRFVLVMRGTCHFRTKFEHVQAAGGAGVIMINTDDDPDALLVMGNLVDGISIPGLMITQAHGQALIAQLDTGAELTGSFSTTHTLPAAADNNDVLASFSSRGPGGGGSNFKPDLAAPGRLIFSTDAGSGVAGVQRRGTSMAAPHVAGMAALLRQRNPGWPPAVIKAILKNSATPSLRPDTGVRRPENLSFQGAGVLRGGAAHLLGSYTLPASVSFGYINSITDQTSEQFVELRNLESHNKIYAVAHEPAAVLTGVTVHCPEEVSVEPLGTTPVSIRITVDAAALAADDGLASFNEVSGWCVLNDGAQSVRIAYLAGVDGASEIRIQPADGGNELINHGPVAGLASSFILAATHTPRDVTGTTIESVGWRESSLFTFPVFELAVVMREPWESLSNLRWFLFVDTDRDGHSERVLYALDWSYFGFNPGSIVTGMDFVSDPADVGSDNHISSWYAEDIDYNDRVAVLPFFMAPSGVNAIFKTGETEFDFRLVAQDRYGEQSEISGHIDLRDPQAVLHREYSLMPGETRPVVTGGDTLWIFSTNPDELQSYISRDRAQSLKRLQQQKRINHRHRDNIQPR
ncbi:MAG: S8 family serine peptidase [Gammaproteobacteria bacterium]|nr:S8 family serine peptidase [Gammaproteobacteria bacterium]